MPWVQFTQDFDFKPKPSVTIAYLAGETKMVTRRCSDVAGKAGKARKITKPKAKADE